MIPDIKKRIYQTIFSKYANSCYKENLWKKSISQFCIKLCGDFFFAKKKVKDPMLDGFKKILQRNFQFKESFLRSAGENNAH